MAIVLTVVNMLLKWLVMPSPTCDNGSPGEPTRSFFAGLLGFINFHSSSVSSLPKLVNSPAPCNCSPPSITITSPLM